jgi:phosphatidylinositol-3-phosphatase
MPSHVPRLRPYLRTHIGGVAGLLVLVVAVGLLTPTMLHATSVKDSASAPARGLPTSILHVFLIMMENEGANQVYGVLPYETKLANTYAWGGDANSNPHAIGYYALCHPSAPNYLGITSGQTLQCGSDGYNKYSVQNIGHELQTAGLSWVAYEESAKTACQETNSGNYAVRHNPFPYYTDLGGNTPGSACMTHVLPIANLTNDYPYSTTPPAFTYIAPNVLDDGHSSSAKYGDNWLSTFLPKLMKQSWFATSVIFITYDESYGAKPDSGYNGLKGGPVFMVAVSPSTKGIGAIDVNCSHYNTLSTLEWLLGLPPTGTGHDGTANFPAMKELFSQSGGT